MNVGLGWLGVSVGAVGCVTAYLMACANATSSAEPDSSRDRRTALLCAAATLLLTLILWAVAMQTRVPFSPGQGLAFGLLIGGVAGAVAIVLSLLLGAVAISARAVRMGTLSSLFLGLCAVSLAYSLFASNPWEPLIGFSIGAAMAAILHTYMGHVTGGPGTRTEAWAVFSITIAAAILLSMRHFDATHLRMWWALPVLVGTTVLIADYIAIELASLGSIRDDAGRSYLVSVLIGAAIVTGLTALYSWKLFDSWELLYTTLAGLGIGAIVAWLFAGLKRDDGPAGALEAGAAGVVLLVAFAVVTFKLWAGLGIATGLIAAWAVAVPALTFTRVEDERPKLFSDAALWPLAVGLAIVVFRLFLQEYRPGLRGSELEVHYTFIGAMLGAILPFVFLAGLARLREARAGGAAIAGVGMMGLISAASPLILALLWGDRSALGFEFGMIAAMAFMLLARLAYGDAKYSIALLVIGAQLIAVQFTGLITRVEATRSMRISVLVAAVVLCLIWFGLSALFAARPSPSSATGVDGVGEEPR